MNNPLVSIVVPIFGVEKYIERCARTLFEQTYSNIEFIFVNDCTKDSSINILQNIIKEYNHLENKIEIIDHEVNLGLAASRNTGVRYSTGDYIMHVDADDWIEPQLVDSMLKEAVRTGADIVVCGAYLHYPNSINLSLPCSTLSKDELIIKILMNSVPGSMWGKIIKSRLYKDHDDTWAIEGINQGEDYVTMPRLLYYANDVSYLGIPLYNYNLCNAASYTNNISERSVDSMLKADTVLEKFFKDKISDEDLCLMKLRTKLFIIKCGNPYLYKSLKNIYIDIPNKIKKRLCLSDRLLLSATEKGFDRILAKYVRFRLKK